METIPYHWAQKAIDVNHGKQKQSPEKSIVRPQPCEATSVFCGQAPVSLIAFAGSTQPVPEAGPSKLPQSSSSLIEDDPIISGSFCSSGRSPKWGLTTTKARWYHDQPDRVISTGTCQQVSRWVESERSDGKGMRMQDLEQRLQCPERGVSGIISILPYLNSLLKCERPADRSSNRPQHRPKPPRPRCTRLNH